jgi:hypothetical protein
MVLGTEPGPGTSAGLDKRKEDEGTTALGSTGRAVEYMRRYLQ